MSDPTKNDDLIEIFPGTLWARPSEIRAVKANAGSKHGSFEVLPYVSVAFDNGGDKDERRLSWPSFSTGDYDAALKLAREIADRIARSTAKEA